MTVLDKWTIFLTRGESRRACFSNRYLGNPREFSPTTAVRVVVVHDSERKLGDDDQHNDRQRTGGRAEVALGILRKRAAAEHDEVTAHELRASERDQHRRHDRDGTLPTDDAPAQVLDQHDAVRDDVARRQQQAGEDVQRAVLARSRARKRDRDLVRRRHRFLPAAIVIARAASPSPQRDGQQPVARANQERAAGDERVAQERHTVIVHAARGREP